MQVRVAKRSRSRWTTVPAVRLIGMLTVAVVTAFVTAMAVYVLDEMVTDSQSGEEWEWLRSMRAR